MPIGTNYVLLYEKLNFKYEIGRIHMNPRDTPTDGSNKTSVTIEPR
jgi:hypothetical protein